jgi:hypothetical protein
VTQQKELWYQGKVAVMDATEKMSYEDISKANAAAEKLVLSALTDKPVAVCENSDDAKRIVACVNAFNGIPDELLGTMPKNAIEGMSKLVVKYNADRNLLADALEALILFTNPSKFNAAALNDAHSALAAVKGGAA